MVKIDDLIEMQKIFVEREEYEQAMKKAASEELQEKYVVNYARYDELDQKLAEMLERAGLENDFYTVKTKFLENLISTNYISQMEETPQEYFKKMIELYGEKELVDFSYTEHDDQWFDLELDSESNYENEMYEENDEYYNQFSNKTFTILDFVQGEEDKIIGMVSNEVLRKQLLGSRLKDLAVLYHNDFEEYVNEAVRHGAIFDANAIKDELGLIDVEALLSNFEHSEISQDKNFYLFLAAHLDEKEMPFETFLDYIDPKMMDSEFGPEICNARNTKQYEYKKEFAYRKPIDPELLAWLRGKDDELSVEEAEAKTISEAEALRDELEGKQGQNKGEE